MDECKPLENGHVSSCVRLASCIYLDSPHARELGHVAEDVREAAGVASGGVTGGGATSGGVTGGGVAASAGAMDGHDVPPDVLTSVAHWLRKGEYDLVRELAGFRKTALEGSNYCWNHGCKVLGHPKDFQVCPQCKHARYCGNACQKEDWNSGGHKARCGTADM